MPLLNVSLVTRTLVNLLNERIPQYPDWPGGGTILTVSPAPPDAVAGTHALSLYLYHVREDAHTKSQDWGVDDPYPLRFKPMGITLNYMLCPRSNIGDVAERTFTDQLLMGLALKTLHDYPYIDESTTTPDGAPVPFMDNAMRLRGNRLRVTMMPKPPDEATQFWQAGTNPMRLAAYYEVAATLLEPDEIRRRVGRVLSYGVHTFVRGKPEIEGTRNTITFTLPGEATPRSIVSSPAEVSYGNTFEVFGADLKGDRTSIFLRHRDFAAPLELDNTHWAVEAGEGRIAATARATDRPVASTAVLPGVYGLIVRTIARRTLPDGSTRDFDFWSDETSFSIAPGILNVGFVASLGTITVDSFDPGALAGADVALYAGGERLTRVNAAPAAGQFHTLAPDQVEFRLPAGTPAGTQVPLRLVVRGAESAPRWETAP
jgi:hypothetical protein